MRKIRDITAKIPLLTRVVSLYVVVFLIAFSVFQVVSLINPPLVIKHPPIAVVKNSAKIIEKVIIDGQPEYFAVERLGVNLPVKIGTYDQSTDSWTLSDDAVYFAAVSKLPNNQSGNTFIYGHNRDQVIAKLSDLVAGDVAVVKTLNGHSFAYIYVGDDVVSANTTSVLFEETEKPRLTVMTCDGAWSQDRRLMYFDLLEAK